MTFNNISLSWHYEHYHKHHDFTWKLHNMCFVLDDLTINTVNSGRYGFN